MPPYAGRVTVSERSAIIVGGGVIGLASAYRLAQAGWDITLFDPALGGGATYAAAGMIAPLAEIAPGEEAGFRQQLGALNAWRLLGDELLELTGEPLRLVERGTLLVGFDASDRRLINQFVEVAEGFGVTIESLTRDDAPKIFCGVSARIESGLLLEGDAWLDPDQVVSLLLRANRLLGVEFVAERVIGASSNTDEVTVATKDASYRADAGLFATGAYELPDGLQTLATTEVRPVRGMTVRVQGLDRSDEPMLRAFVRGRPIYIVSRPGGYCVIGASSDEQRSLGIEVGELQRLLRDALDIIPELESATVIETRQGLRPATADLAPFIERIGERWLWSSGFYRHGVTLAPLAATDVAHAFEVHA
jgi:glycine oxidase